MDARPLDGDFCFTEDSEDTEGGKDILGFIDPENEPVSEKGEYKVYSRDSTGAIKAFIHLKNDGSIEIDAPAGLKITANTEITGTLTVSGIIKSAVDIIADFAITAISLLNHFSLGNLGYNTGTPLAGPGVSPPGTPPSVSGNDLVDGNGTKSTQHTHIINSGSSAPGPTADAT